MTEPAPTPSSSAQTTIVDRKRVACDGGGGALGHPRVWYSLEDGEAVCGYCDRKFVYAPDKGQKR
jgi:uncharacterized Zn-finger protein